MPGSGAARQGATDGQRMRIVVVDDNETHLEILVKILARGGYDPIPFTSSRSTLADPERWACATVAVVDVHLCDGDGQKLADDMVALAPGLKVLLLSGDSEFHTLAHYRFLAKPVFGTDLLQMIAKLITNGH